MMITRSEERGDFAAIREVVQATFERPAEADLIERIRVMEEFDPQLSLVATLGHRVIGHILFSKIQIVSESARSAALALAPLAVLPQYQGQGIGSGLVLEGLRRSKIGGHAIVVVLGEPGFYGRFGFQTASDFAVEAPFKVPREAFMVVELTPGALTGVRGIVRYSKPFEDF